MNADKKINVKEKILTVIVPAYNMEWCLENNLKTYVLPELSQKLSVIVLDNSSEDKTFDIANHFANCYPEIFTCIHKENNGYGSSVNLGISMVNSKYFRVIDADDCVNSKDLKNFILNLENCEADIVQTPYTKIDIKTKKREKVNLTSKFGTTLPIEKAIEQIPVPGHHTTTIKTEFFRSHPFNLLENTFYVDEELVIYPFFYAKTICSYDDNVYCYSINNENQSVSVSNKVKYLTHRERIIKRLMDEYMKAFLAPENDIYVKNRIALSVGNHFTTLYMLHHNRKLGKSLANEFSDFLKQNHPMFYNMVRTKKKLLNILNTLKVSIPQYERLKKIFKF